MAADAVGADALVVEGGGQPGVGGVAIVALGGGRQVIDCPRSPSSWQLVQVPSTWKWSTVKTGSQALVV